MALPPAVVGKPEADLECKSGPTVHSVASGRAERQPGMGTPESSIPSDTFRTGAHVTLAPGPVRIWHAETNDSEHRHEQSPVAAHSHMMSDAAARHSSGPSAHPSAAQPCVSKRDGPPAVREPRRMQARPSTIWTRMGRASRPGRLDGATV